MATWLQISNSAKALYNRFKW